MNPDDEGATPPLIERWFACSAAQLGRSSRSGEFNGLSQSAGPIVRCYLVDVGLEIFVDTLVRTEFCQRSEPNQILHQHFTIENTRGQH